MVLSVVSLNLCSFLAQEQFYSIRYQFLESLATTDLNDFLFFFFGEHHHLGEIQLGSSCGQKAALPWAGWVWLPFSVCKASVLHMYLVLLAKMGKQNLCFAEAGGDGSLARHQLPSSVLLPSASAAWPQGALH